MSKVFIYVVDRDFGFAPNPFHGFCTLATCKQGIRNSGQINDWIIGVGGGKLKATGKCIYAMRVSKKVSFNEYWFSREYAIKKPVRNGSSKMIVGDNIYFHDLAKAKWFQADSHHSNTDGTLNHHNLNSDTKSENVLISDYFYYFGSNSPIIPNELLEAIGYKNGRNYRVFYPDEDNSLDIINWIESTYNKERNLILGDPYNFDISHKRYDSGGNKVL